ncbi:hypothetical protein Mapa_001174 [Marchantia paleacea]|nr:hypothetical protein Mapa_001174 [Marchantia paleacea]
MFNLFSKSSFIHFPRNFTSEQARLHLPTCLTSMFILRFVNDHSFFNLFVSLLFITNTEFLCNRQSQDNVQLLHATPLYFGFSLADHKFFQKINKISLEKGKLRSTLNVSPLLKSKSYLPKI